jgi:hypothetical protein
MLQFAELVTSGAVVIVFCDMLSFSVTCSPKILWWHFSVPGQWIGRCATATWAWCHHAVLVDDGCRVAWLVAAVSPLTQSVHWDFILRDSVPVHARLVLNRNVAVMDDREPACPLPHPRKSKVMPIELVCPSRPYRGHVDRYSGSISIS